MQSDAEPATEADQPQPSRETSTAAESLTHLFATYGLTGTESEPLGKVGLDSLRRAEFAHDLKTHIEQQGLDDLSQQVDLRILQIIAVSELFAVLRDIRPDPCIRDLGFGVLSPFYKKSLKPSKPYRCKKTCEGQSMSMQ